jgi:hypothetical protein
LLQLSGFDFGIESGAIGVQQFENPDLARAIRRFGRGGETFGCRQRLLAEEPGRIAQLARFGRKSTDFAASACDEQRELRVENRQLGARTQLLVLVAVEERQADACAENRAAVGLCVLHAGREIEERHAPALRGLLIERCRFDAFGDGRDVRPLLDARRQLRIGGDLRRRRPLQRDAVEVLGAEEGCEASFCRDERAAFRRESRFRSDPLPLEASPVVA